jgi:hypothetical protein
MQADRAPAVHAVSTAQWQALLRHMCCSAAQACAASRSTCALAAFSTAASPDCDSAQAAAVRAYDLALMWRLLQHNLRAAEQGALHRAAYLNTPIRHAALLLPLERAPAPAPAPALAAAADVT